MPVIKTRETRPALKPIGYLSNLLEMADAHPPAWTLAERLRLVLQKPIDRRTNAEYQQIVAELVEMFGLNDICAWQRSLEACCARWKEHHDYYYDRCGLVVCNICVPRKWHSNICEPFRSDI